MRTARIVTIVLVCTGVAGAALAAGLSKYKNWASSPEAYFLSKEERAKWDTITSDAEAEKFIAAYKAARGKGFEAAIQSRIDYADKNFKLGKKRGSETLRGKTLVILGPPTRVLDSGSTSGKTKFDPTSGDFVAAGGGDSKGGGNVGNMHSNAGGPGADTMRGMQAATRTVTTEWIYDASNVPPALHTDHLNLEFQVQPDDGKEEVADPQKLEQMLNAVVEYWKPKS